MVAAVAELTAPVEDGGAGLSNREAAEVLGVGSRTVDRDVAPNDAPSLAAPEGRSAAGASNDAPDPAPEPTPKEQAAKETKTRRDVSRSASVLPDAMEALVRVSSAVPQTFHRARRGAVTAGRDFGTPFHEWAVSQLTHRASCVTNPRFCYGPQ